MVFHTRKRIMILIMMGTVPIQALMQYQKLNAVKVTTKDIPTRYCALQMRLNPESFSGTKYTITEFPRPALRRTNIPITDFSEDFQGKTKEMISIMYQANGVGLAAPQIGLNELLFVYNPTGSENSKNMERIICNPIITKYSDQVEIEEEGCLSLRSDFVSGRVARSSWIEVEYQNESGQKVKRRLKGFEARVFQHEYDHLNGILCYDRFPPEDREKIQKNIEYLLGLYEEKDAIVEPNEKDYNAMQPRPLTAKHMPPLDFNEAMDKEDDVISDEKGPSKGGFGNGGFGASKKKNTKKNTSKEKKVKQKVRNGAFSSNPTFK